MEMPGWGYRSGIFFPLARGSTPCSDHSGSTRWGRAPMIDTRGRTARERQWLDGGEFGF
jgi:hypothetical protein